MSSTPPPKPIEGLALIAPAVVTVGLAALFGAANSGERPQVQGYFFMGGFALGLLIGLCISMVLGSHFAHAIPGTGRRFFAAVGFGLAIWVGNLVAAWAGIAMWMSFGG